MMNGRRLLCNFHSMFSAARFRNVYVWSFGLLFPAISAAQTLGGQAAYNFLRLPSSPLLAAMGGVNLSYPTTEVSYAANNPALLRQNLNGQLSLSFNAFVAATKAYSATGAFYSQKLKATFGGHVHFLDYGSLPNTDAAGNRTGDLRPVDYVMQASVGKTYLQKWSYGLTLKFIHSGYGAYRSSALAADVGVFYRDSARGFSASVLAKNMGTQLTTFAGETQELPFDLQVGATKRLAKAPFGFSLTAQRLQTFDILYNDSAFNRDNNFSSSTSFLNKAALHLVFATHVYIVQNIEAHIGYNVLRRKELSYAEGGNGLTGFSAGLLVRFSKLQILYARSAYQRAIAANQVGISLYLDRMFGLGK